MIYKRLRIPLKFWNSNGRISKLRKSNTDMLDQILYIIDANDWKGIGC